MVAVGIGSAVSILKGRGQAGLALGTNEASLLRQCADNIAAHGLPQYATLARALLAKGIWRRARPDDQYIREEDQSGDTVYAYTLSNGKHPSAIVLAPRFFTEDLSLAARSSYMIHEMGHYQAYVATGKSTEFDGYKAQYDAAKSLGLSETDGLVYFMMLDGVQEYVVPIDPSYGRKADVRSYIQQSGT